MHEAWLHRPPRYQDRAPLSWSPTGAEKLAIGWPEVISWKSDARWMDVIRRGIHGHARVGTTPLEQPWRGIVTMLVSAGGPPTRAVIDYNDDVALNHDALESSRVYFKMQYTRRGYDDERVIPGGFPPFISSLFAMLGALRRDRDRKAFDHEVSGRFTLGYSELRDRAVQALHGQSAFEFTGDPRPVRYSAYLRETARSKVCVDLPGRGPFCFRLVDYLSIGTCIVAAPHDALMHAPLVDGEHLVYARPDVDDLVGVCARLVEDDAERERLAAGARDYFDRYLTPRQIGAYYVARLLSA